jgi:hypothetical protein
MPKKSEYPKVIKAGSVAVRIYRVKHKTTLNGWAYTLAWTSGGRRRLQQFASEAEASEEGRVKAAQLAEGRVEAADMTRSDRDDLQAARDISGSVPFLAALEEWRRARDLTQGQLIPAAEAWAVRNVTKFTRIKVDAAIDAFIAAKERAGKQGERTYSAKLRPLKDSFKDRFLDTIGAAEFTAYLEQYQDGVTRNDFRKRAVALCRWAQRLGHLPKHVTLEIEETERAVEKRTQIGIITPATYGQLLRYFLQNHPEHLAALILAGFCGVRADEIHGKRSDRTKRQTWEDIHLDRRFVQVTVAKTNTPSWRIVPLCNAAVEWLQRCPDRGGAVCEPGAMERVRALSIAAGFPLPENCFRHSFISYRIAATANKPQVATEAGNSVSEIDRRYRVPLPKDQGEEWFRMSPAKADKLPTVRAPTGQPVS